MYLYKCIAKSMTLKKSNEKINLHKKDKNDYADVRCKSYGVELKVKLKCNRNL